MSPRKIAQMISPMLLCVVLVACTTAVTPVANTQMTATPASEPSLMQRSQNIPENGTIATILPDAYPAPLPSTTPVPYPMGSGGKPTPYYSPTPDLSWNTEVIYVNWDGYGKVDQPEWLSNTVAKLAVYSDGFSDAYVTVDITAGRDAKAVGESINSDWKIYSPKKTFVIECGGGMRMYRVKGHSLVSETSLMPLHSHGVVCSSSIRWAPNESAVSFVTDDQAVYVWPVDGSEARKVVENAYLSYTAWAPDSLKLAIARTGAGSRISTISVTDAVGQVLHEFQLQAGYDGVIVDWLTDEVLAIYISRYTTHFYEFRTGQFLFSWTSMPTGNGIFHQSPKASPNGRWVFIDQGDQRYESVVNPNRLIVQKQYSLYDIQTKRRYSLLNHLGDYLGFAGWSADSSVLYVISRPAESVSISDPSTPFGLLAYDVQAHQFKSLFKDAVQVAWNADKSWAFVVFTDRGEQGQLGLAGGLWKVGTDTLIGKWHISDQMVYTDPASDSPIYSSPIPIAWSHDQQRVVVSDKFGRIKPLNLDGTENILTTSMPDKRLALRWSPDDRHLLVEQGNQAWIVDLLNSNNFPAANPFSENSPPVTKIVLTPVPGGIATLSPEEEVTLNQDLKKMADITLESNGQTITLTLNSRFFVFLDDDKYPVHLLNCEPKGLIGYISNGSFRGPDRYPIYFEPIRAGRCTLRNGDFAADVVIVEPTLNSPTRTPLSTYVPSYP